MISNFKIKYADNKIQVNKIGSLKVEEVTLEYLTKFWFDYKTRLENEIATFETAIKNWKLQPTPRERLGK